jgi:hypothetical protein
MVATPFATDVTTADVPEPLTVATDGLVLVHATEGETATPAVVITVAVNVVVAPAAVKLAVAGVILTAVTAGGGMFTTTLTVAVLPDEVAVTLAVPLATAVTTAELPDPLTVATAGLLLVHATVGDCATPAVVFTVAARVCVPPAAVSVTLAGETPTAVTVTAGTTGPVLSGASLPPPQAANHMIADIARNADLLVRMSRSEMENDT